MPTKKKKKLKLNQSKNTKLFEFLLSGTDDTVFDRKAYAAHLMFQQKFTDDEIIEKVNKKFEDYAGQPFNQIEVSRTRRYLRDTARTVQGYPVFVEALKSETAYGRVVKNGKEKPSKSKNLKSSKMQKQAKPDAKINSDIENNSAKAIKKIAKMKTEAKADVTEKVDQKKSEPKKALKKKTAAQKVLDKINNKKKKK